LQGAGSPAGTGRATLTGIVGPNFFRTAGIPLLRGRDFNAADQKASPKVAILNDVAAGRFWPGQDPIGKAIQFAGENLPVEIVGVAHVADYQSIGEPPQSMIYLAIEQYYSASGVIYIRGAGDLDGALAAVRRNVQSLDPNLLLQSETVRFTLRQTLWTQSLSAGLLTLFGGLATILATIGIYGVISYSTNLRIREFGLRTALGATPGNLQLVVVTQGIRLVAIGVLIGLGVSLWMAHLLQPRLFVTSPRDALTFVLAPSILTLVGVLACWFPARRATRIDPATALRDE
jgi:predicted permease